MDKRPNIILLMADQMRGDCLGIAGHPDVKTPFLDALAAEGVRYENAYSACPTCVPARATLYTGMSQEHTGRVGYEDLVPWDYPHTLAGELSKAGYYTQCVGKMHVHPLRNNLGFHDVRLHDGYLHAYRRPTTPSYEDQRVADDYYWWLKQQLGVDADPVDTGLDCNSWVVHPWIYEEKYHPTNWVASECRDFLRRRDRSKPFFLMASFVRPHPPLDAPEYYLNLYKDESLAEPWRGDWNDCVRWERDGHSYHAQTAPSDECYIQQLRAGYYAAITHMDRPRRDAGRPPDVPEGKAVPGQYPGAAVYLRAGALCGQAWYGLHRFGRAARRHAHATGAGGRTDSLNRGRHEPIAPRRTRISAR